MCLFKKFVTETVFFLILRISNSLFCILSIKNLQYSTRYLLYYLQNTLPYYVRIRHHEEQDVMSTPWLKEGNENKKPNYIELLERNIYQKGDLVVAWRMAKIWMKSFKLTSFMDKMQSKL